MPFTGRRLQRLRSRLGVVRLAASAGVSRRVGGVSRRLAATATLLRERSYAAAGFPAAPLLRSLGGGGAPDDDADDDDDEAGGAGRGARGRQSQLRSAVVK